jgi:myosin heavy subunit
MNQLTCNGVLEGIRICRKGFPNRMMHIDFKQRYAILAADAAKQEATKKCSDEMMAAVVKSGALTEEDFRVGLTKVFFKAGILAKMEELREFKLSSLLKLLQAEIRSYTAITALPKKKEYVAAQLTIKNNIRSWTEVRTWSWFQLLGRVKGMFETMREQARMAAIEGLYNEAKEKLAGSETTRNGLKAAIEQARKDKEETLAELEATCGGFREAELKISELVEARVALSEELESLTKRLQSAESEYDEMTRASHNMEGETANFKSKISNFEKTVKSLEKSNKERDAQIAALQAETSAQADAQEKLKKEVATLGEVNEKYNGELRALDEKVETLSKEKSDTEKNLNKTEDGMKKEKRERSEIDAARRKAETELMLVMQKIEELLRAQSEWDQSLKRKDQELQTLDGYLMDERQQSARLQEQIGNIGKAVRVKF